MTSACSRATTRRGTLEVKIGVTGPLVLDAMQREAVARAVSRLLDDPRWPSQVMDWTIVSGMAAGADLVLGDALLASLRQHGARVQMCAWLAKPVERMHEDWLRRAAELGPKPSAAAQRRVDALREQQLAGASIETLQGPWDEDPYRWLAARLALECDVLIAVSDGSRPGSAGGSAEVVEWRRRPDGIPEALRQCYPLSASRALAVIDAGSGMYRLEAFAPLSDESDLLRRVLNRLAAGNALAANDLAADAIERGNRDPKLCYAYLQSLGACGNARRALERYEQLAPPPSERDEDWLALLGRLHKDLAFAGVVADDHLRAAAQHYRAAYEKTGGAFSAINAATMALLAGQDADADHFAREALARCALHGGVLDERDRYYQAVTSAEAHAVLGDAAACAACLQEADPLLRNDLAARSRSRAQIARVLEARGLDTGVARRLALPDVYVVDTDSAADSPPRALAQRLSGSPVFALAPVDLAGLSMLERLVGLGARLNIVLREASESALAHFRETWGAEPTLRLRMLIEAAEQVSVFGGFLPVEAGWRDSQSVRFAHGLAAVQAQRLGVTVRKLCPAGWHVDAPAEAPPAHASATRRMLGLVFTDMVGFSRFSDAEIRVYWTEIVPRLASTIAAYGSRVLLKQTWGDALHVVTDDAQTAARVSLELIDAVRALREGYSGRLGALDIRVGAHYAPAWVGHDTVQSVPTYYGSQLSFAARVEPVTPPGSVYVSDALSAELQLEAPGQFQLEYAGEVTLAKKYGRFRLYSLLHARR